MDGLNQIDDDLTEFINQIANSNEGDSPSSSTNCSSDTSSIKQIEPVEVIEQKTVLPPCQVCGGNSSGFHYGAITCEACKLFFRRSLGKKNFKCTDGSENCKPAENSTYFCKFCRLKKCLSLNMSPNKVVRGRYAQRECRKNYCKNSSNPIDVATVPLLLSFSDSDDIILRNSVNFLPMRNVEWSKVVPNLNDKIYRVQKVLCTNFYSVENYLDYYEATGLELDERCTALDLTEDLLEMVFINILPFVIGLPGMKDVKKKDFFREFLSSGSLAHLALSRDKICSFDENFHVINLNGFRIPMRIDMVKALLSEDLVDFKIRSMQIIENTELTDQEYTFICALNLLSPHRRISELSYHYKRIVSAFTRYLTSTYGKDYIRKFQTILSLMSHYNQSQSIRSRVSKRSDKYFDTVFKKPIVKAIYGVGNIDELIEKIAFDNYLNN